MLRILLLPSSFCIICSCLLPSSIDAIIFQDMPNHSGRKIGNPCLPCHEVQREWKTMLRLQKGHEGEVYFHAPYSDNQCSACHNPEEDTFKYPFDTSEYVRYSKSSYDLCWTCHEKEHILGREDESNTQFRHGELNLHTVHVVRDRGVNCVNCHDPHASITKYLVDPCRMDPGEGRRFPCEWGSAIEYNDNGGRCSTVCHRDYSYSRNALTKD